MQNRMVGSAIILFLACMPLLDWLAYALVALITLRRGMFDGGVNLFVAILPLVLMMVIAPQDAGVGADAELAILVQSLQKLEAVNSIIAVLVAFIAANVLRTTIRFDYAVLLCAGLVLAAIASGIVDIGHWATIFKSQIDLVGAEVDHPAIAKLQALMMSESVSLNYFIGQYLGFIIASKVFFALLVARWWQARLYNPGGFRKEFASFSLSAAVVVGILFSVILLEFFVPEVAGAGWIMMIPVVLLGAAVFHHLVIARFNLSSGWVVLFYLTLPLTHSLVAVLGCMDSFFNIRKRFDRAVG